MLLKIIVPTAVPIPASLPAVVVVPIPTDFVTVNIPVTIAPELFAATLTSLPNLIVDASMPVKAVPLPTKLVAVTIPENTALPSTLTLAATPGLAPTSIPSLAVIKPTESIFCYVFVC